MEESIKRRHKPLERRARTFSWPAPRFFTQSTRRRQWPSFAGLKQEISARDDAKGKRNKISRQDAKAQRKEGKSIEYYGPSLNWAAKRRTHRPGWYSFQKWVDCIPFSPLVLCAFASWR